MMMEGETSTSELVMRAHARFGPEGRPSAQDMQTMWALVGVEVGSQLVKRRGVRLEGVGTVVLAAKGVVLLGEGCAESVGGGARPGAALGLAAVATAAARAGVDPRSAKRATVAKVVRCVLAELRRCSSRRQRCRLALRPVGDLGAREARSEAEEGVALKVAAAFDRSCARSWDANVAVGARAYGGAAVTRWWPRT